MVKVSCIIPAYNEEARIGNVLAVVENHPLIHEVIVVDDCSKDKTREIVSTFKNVTLIVHEKNQGKSAAIHRGLSAVEGEYVLFLDADLVGLTADSVTELVKPVTTGEAEVSISYRGNAPRLWRTVGFDYISGERVFRRDLLDGQLDTILSLPKFGLEVFLNDLIVKKGSRIKIVELPSLVSPFKHQKYGVWKGFFVGDLGMMKDIFMTSWPWSLGLQILRMRKLIVR